MKASPVMAISFRALSHYLNLRSGSSRIRFRVLFNIESRSVTFLEYYNVKKITKLNR